MAILLSLIYLYPILVINNKDSLCAVREHSYQLLNCTGYVSGGKQAGWPPKKEHTHIVKVNLIIDKVFKKSYIILQMKGTHD